MKKYLKLLIILPIIFVFFSGCSKSPTNIVNLSVCYDNTVHTLIYNNTQEQNKQIFLADMVANNFDSNKLDKYSKIEINANPEWTYKLFIEKIEFFVITNESFNEPMNLTLLITNMADENNISSPGSFETKEIFHNCEANKAQKHTVYVNKVVATATSSKITFDIYESSELLVDTQTENFKWFVYGLKIYGEHREYNK